MFYAQFVLSKKGPLAKIWLAAHWEKKLSKQQIYETNVEKAVDEIMQPKVKMALRTTGHLLLGIVRIYSRKAKYLLADCNEAFLKIKMAFRPGQVDLPEDNREAAVAAITLPEMFTDFDPNLPDFADLDNQFITFNQSRLDEITLKEDLPSRNSFASEFNAMDDFGESQMSDGAPTDPIASAESFLTNASIERGRAASVAPTPQRPLSISNIHDDLATPIPQGDLIDDNFGDFGAAGDHLFVDAGDLFADEKPLADDDMLSLSGNRPHTALAPGDDETMSMKNPENETSFGLQSLNSDVLDKLKERASKRKRRLIVDEVKNISGEEMKAQMSDYSDTLAEWELAPPNRRLMYLKHCTVDRMLITPSADDRLVAPALIDLYGQCHDYQLMLNERDTRREASVLEDLELIPTDRLRDWRQDSERPGTAQLSMIPEHEDAEVMDVVAAPGEDDPFAVDLTQAPIDEEVDATSPRERVKKRSSKIEVQRHSHLQTTRKSLQKFVDDTYIEEDEAVDSTEDKRWTKRTQHILNTIKSKIDASDEGVISFSDISKGATRKSAAQKFYTLLVLKKWQAIDVLQEKDTGDFSEIFIRAGANINQQPAH